MPCRPNWDTDGSSTGPALHSANTAGNQPSSNVQSARKRSAFGPCASVQLVDDHQAGAEKKLVDNHQHSSSIRAEMSSLSVQSPFLT